MKHRVNPNEGFYSISQVAKLLHVSTHTIRNLEREFSLEVSKDSVGNRVYTLETIEKYRLLIQKKNEGKFSKFELVHSRSKNDESFQYMTDVADATSEVKVEGHINSTSEIEEKNDSSIKTLHYNKKFNSENNSYSNANNINILNSHQIRNLIPLFSPINLISSVSKLFGVVSYTVIALFSLTLIGAFSLNTFLKDYDPNKLLLSFEQKNMSNVLQSTTEDWTYRFDVNVPAYMNNSLNVTGTLAGSNANFQIITVGRVIINETGISAPNVVNLLNTRAGESVILVDNTNRNQPIVSLAVNPKFTNVTINNLNGVTQLDDTTIQTIQDNIEIPTANADAETLGGLSSTDFLRSNANTVYTGGTLEFSPTSSVKFSNLSSNTFLRLNSQNVLTSFDITAGPNISISSTANSLVISANTGATSNVFSSAAIKDLFIGSTSFDENYRLVSTATELNKLHTLSGNLVTSSNISSILLSTFTNIDTNASDDLDNAVLITSLGGKTIYSTNTWYGTQDFAKIKADNIEVESNGFIKLSSGSVPINTDSSLYNYGNRIYFKDLPLAQVANTSINDNVNKLALFVTNASGELFLQGTSNLALDVFETGANGQVIGVYGNSTKYLTVVGDISVSSTSSSQINFQLNNVNTNAGTFGSSSFTPVITVNSKGQITSITTVPSSSNFTSSIAFSTPIFGTRNLLLKRDGLTDLTASFSFGALDITTALGYTPVNKSGDTVSGSLVITQTLAGATLFQNGNLVCDTSGNCSDIYGGGVSSPNNYVTGITFSTPVSAQRTLTLTRQGLSNLTATFSMTSSDVITALGYTPLQASDTEAEKFINSFGLSTNVASQNISYTLSIARNDGVTFPVNFALTPLTITTALGYTPVNNTGDTISGSLVITQTLASATIYQNGSIVCDRSGNCSDIYIDTTNANNYVTAITFSTPVSAQRTLTLTRQGLSNLTATFSMTSSDVITALGYTPLQASDTAADKFINSFGIGKTYISQNVELNFSLGRSDNTVILASTYLTPKEITTALGYTPLQASSTEAEKFINSFGLSTNVASQNISYTLSIARNDGVTFPVNFALTPLTITTALGYTPLQASDTTPSYFVSSISFSDAAANTKVFTLNRQGTNALSAIFSLSSSDIITGLGYTPLNTSGGTISGNLTITGSLSSSSIFQNGNVVCDFTGNCNQGHIFGSGTTGYISLFNSSSSISNSNIFQSSLNIGIGTTNPGELLDVFGAIKLSQDMGTAPRTNALYQSGGVLYWNGQAVGVVGSTAPGGISGTKDYLPYFNTANTLIATEFRYTSNSSERGLDLSSQNNLEVYLGVGHQNDISARFGVASNDEGTSFFSRFESHDDLIIENLSNRETSDVLFVNKNALGSFLYTFGKNDSEAAGVIFKFNTISNRALVGINTTNPTFDLDVIGSAKVSETFAVSTFSNPGNNSFVFLSGGNFRGNISGAIGTFNNLTLANALGINYGGTGLTQTPGNGQILIGSNGGYALAPITAGTNVSISTSAGGITINAVLGGTNANNYVTGITFSVPEVAQRTLVLNRLGLSDLTAVFSLSSGDITSALGYTPLQASSTEAAKFINSFGLSSTSSSQNVSYFFSIARNDGVTFPVSFALNPSVITTALGYIPLQASDTSADKYIESIGTDFNYISQNVQMNISFGRSDLVVLNAQSVFTPAVITTALGYTPLQASDTAADKFINSFGLSTNIASENISYTLSIARNDGVTFPVNFALTPLTITMALGYTPVNAGDTSAETFINSYGVSSSFLSQNVTYNFSIARNDGITFPASISLTPSVITTALGYTPVNKSGDTFSGSLVVLQTLSSASIYQNGNLVCDTSGNCSNVYLDTTNANNFVSSISFSDLAANIKLFTLNREGTNALSAIFSLSSSDITTALGYTPLQASDTAADKFINSFGLSTNIASENISYTLSIARNDGVTFPVNFALTPLTITTALGYTPVNASDTSADTFINSYGVSSSFLSQNVTYNFSIARNDGTTFPASISLTPSVITTALGYIPLKNTSDTLAGSLTVTGNLYTNQLYTSTAVATVSLSARHLFLADTFYTDKFLHIDPNIGNYNSKLILDLNVGSSINTTLGMYFQSVKFSSPLSLDKNLTFNILNPELNTRLDIVTTGTIPTIVGNTINLYGAALLGEDASFTNLGVTNKFSSGTANVIGNLSAGTAFINGYFSAGNSSLAGLTLTGDLVGTTGNFSGNFSLGTAFINGYFSAGNSTLGNTTIVGNFSASTANFAGNVTLDSSRTFASSFFSAPISTNVFTFLGGTIATSNLSIAGNAVFTNNGTLAVGYFSSPLSTRVFDFNAGTISTSFFSAPNLTNTFTFLGNISAANGTFLSLSAQTLNINNLFTVDSTGSVFNNNVTFNDTIEFNAVGDLAVANDLVFTNTALSKVRSANDLTFEVGEPFNSSNLTVNLFNSGEFIVNGRINVTSSTLSASDLQTSRLLTGQGSITICRNSTTGLLGQCTSSLQYKTNVEDLTLGMAEILQLRPVTFDWKDGQGSDFGFIAEEVNAVNPILAELSEKGDIAGVRYRQLTALLVKGIQEQQVQIENLSIAQSTINFSEATSMYNSLMNTIDALSMSTDNGDLVVGTDLIVNGKTILNETTFTGDVQMGQMSFNTLENSLNVLGASCVRPDGTLDDALCQTQALFLMKNKAGNLNIFDGKVVLKPNGDMQVEKINVTEIKADEYKVASTSQVSGTETLLANQTEIVINTTKVKANSKVFVTASNNLEGKTLYVDEKVDGVSFKVKINQSMTTDVKFDWFILNVE